MFQSSSWLYWREHTLWHYFEASETGETAHVDGRIFKFGLFQLCSLHLLVPTTKIHEWKKWHKYWVLEIELFHSVVQAMQKWMVSEQDWVNTKLLPLNCVHWHRVKMAAASCAWHRIFQCVARFNFSHRLHILFVDCHECKASDGCFAETLDCSEHSKNISFASNFATWTFLMTGCKEGPCYIKFKIILMLAETEKCFKGFMQLSTPVAELFNIFELRKILLNKKDDRSLKLMHKTCAPFNEVVQ